MQSILIILQKPALDQAHRERQWRDATGTIATALQTTQSDQEIAEGVFLIESSSGLKVLGFAIAAAERAGLSYRVLFIEQATEWSHDPNVKPKP